MSTRRQFLGQMGATSVVALGAVPPAFFTRAAHAAQKEGKDAGGRVLVLVQLSGGNDGLNTVVPYGDDAYYRARPGIGVGKGAVLKLDDFLGLHPNLVGFKEVYDEGALAIVQGVGYPNPDHSHFRSMDIWHSAVPESVDIDDGWIGRALDGTMERHAGAVPALCLGEEKLPLALVSSRVSVPTIRNLDSYRLKLPGGSETEQKSRQQLVERLAQPHAAGTSDLHFLRQTAATAYSSARRLESVRTSYKPAAAYPSSGLANKLKLIAQMIGSDMGTEIYFVSLGGFDTHSAQQGGHNALLRELSEGLTAFYRDLQGHKLADRVLTVTFSEFGRRVKENGSLGTDHGTASQMFVLSPAVKGGPHGKHPSLTDLVNGDLKHSIDFRSVYATLMDKWLGYPSTAVLGKQFDHVGFV